MNKLHKKKRPKSLLGFYFRYSDIRQQDEVHHQGVDDRRDSNDLVVKDQGTASDGDGLCGILHTDLDDECTPLFGGQFEQPCQEY